MKKIVLLTLATAASASFAFAQNMDTAGYKQAHNKAESDYKAAKKACKSLKDNAQDICEEEAKVARAKAERDAVAQYKNTPRELEKANRKLADAEYELADERCDELSGDSKDSCENQARTAKANALASLGAGTTMGTTAGTSVAGTTGDGRTAVLVPNADRNTVANNAADVRDRTAAAADRMGDRTAAAADRLGDKTAAAAATAKEKTSNLAGTAQDKTADASVAMSDTMITAKVKADMAADKTAKAMDVHVETQKGVVMLSGFVASKAEADRAVELARGVKGVTDVKSSIQVKK
ncbi:BON domain-containing protein [[Empedobacter] haloabium]|uniref:BON domain-containing protein n=1 Tax=[Empedobacter] haloabium TaxID=592317 RepID=A0ABZ1UIW8_9BURK